MSRAIERSGALGVALQLILVLVIGASLVGLSLFVSVLKPSVVAVLLLGAFLAVLLASRPVVLLWFATGLTLVVTGLAGYFLPAIGQLQWVAYGTAALLFVPALLSLVRGRQHVRLPWSPLMGLSLAVFVVASLTSTIYFYAGPGQVIVAAKSLFMFGGVWAFFHYCRLSDNTVLRWLKGLLFIGAFQVVPALYQYVFVRGFRVAGGEGATAGDAVVGSFGGAENAGGLSAVMAIYLVIGLLVLVSLYREGLLRGRRALLLSVLFSLPLLLAEVKAIFFYIPAGLLVLYRRDILHRPLKFIMGATGIGLLLFGGLLAYQALQWSVQGGGFEQNLRKLMGYSFKVESHSPVTDQTELSRIGVLQFWWQEHSRGEPGTTLIGHGLGSSRTGGQVLGNIAAQYYPKQIDGTAASLFLWETGVMGLLGIFGILLAAFLQAGAAAKRSSFLPWQRALARALQAAVPLFAMSLPYRNDIPYAGPMMFTLMAVLGLISWLNRRANHAFV